ncbi:MAG: type I 3-dehydroquinate dehydratase [Nitrospirae bacterium]|nr:type I 3-dehydroquinate dehydratase [Nitrospirota bacterium]
MNIEDIKSIAAPLVVCAATDRDIVNLTAQSLAEADVLELRVDMFSDISLPHVIDIFKSARKRFGKPIIATVRDINEGGEREIPDRLNIYKAIIPFADMVDAEINSGSLLEDLKALCKTNKKILLGSYHNFECTPENAFLENILAIADRAAVDIAKIALMPKDKDDMIRLLLFTLMHKDRGIITMSMGDIGLPSRVFGAVFGSLMTYGYVNHPSAPGQLSISELMDIFKRLKLR